MSVRMLYLSCVKIRELHLSREKNIEVFVKILEMSLITFNLIYNAIILKQ